MAAAQHTKEARFNRSFSPTPLPGSQAVVYGFRRDVAAYLFGLATQELERRLLSLLGDDCCLGRGGACRLWSDPAVLGQSDAWLIDRQRLYGLVCCSFTKRMGQYCPIRMAGASTSKGGALVALRVTTYTGVAKNLYWQCN